MRLSKAQKALPIIQSYLDKEGKSIWSKQKLRSVFENEHYRWGLPTSMSFVKFVEFMTSESHLSSFNLEFPNSDESRFSWRQASFLEFLMSLRETCFVSHRAALRLHGLTENLSKTIFVNWEQEARSDPNAKLVQGRIDGAFKRPQRLSNETAEYGNYQITMLRGQNTGNAGVVKLNVFDYVSEIPANIRISSLERTLIDCTVRPAYAGGVSEVLRAFELASDTLSVNRLVALLNRIGYLYPYHQAIGFLMERTGAYPGAALDQLRKMPMNFDFYLTHQMRDPVYDKNWRLYVPKGF